MRIPPPARRFVAFALSNGCKASVTASMSSPAAMTKHTAPRKPIKNAPSDPGERGDSFRSSVMPRNSAEYLLERNSLSTFPFFALCGRTCGL